MAMAIPEGDSTMATTRVTFTTANVGDGNNNDPDGGGAAVRLQNLDESGDPTGSEIRVSDEGLHLVAGDGSFFEVRDLISGAVRGSQFSTVHLGTSDIDNFLGGDLNDYLNGGLGDDLLQGGLGDDFIIGGAGDDVLTGAAGADTFIGGAGNDRIDGGVGVDTVTFEDSTAGVTVRLNGGATSDGLGGTDTLYGIENAVGTAFNDTMVGNGADNVLNGGGGADYLLGLNGDDVLIGGSGSANTLQGGGGNDRYVVSANDTIIEAAGEGIDTVETTMARQRLTANVENLTFVGTGGFTGIGNAGDNTITGGEGRDTLIGLAGNDTLVGGSGEANELYGGLGDDVYVVSANDTIVEQAGEGLDAVLTTLNTFTLAANVENLDFTGEGDFTGTGNAGANVIQGGSGADTLSGRGGNDTLIGGDGDDVAVYVGNRADYTIELTLDGYRVTDNTAGRDGVDLLMDVERVTFADGQTLVLADLFPPASEAASASLFDAQIIPDLDDGFMLDEKVAPDFAGWTDDRNILVAPDEYARLDAGHDVWA